MTMHELKLVRTETAVIPEQPRGNRLVAALLSWWRHRVTPPSVPSYLREDIGLPPEADASDWNGVPMVELTPVLLALWRG